MEARGVKLPKTAFVSALPATVFSEQPQGQHTFAEPFQGGRKSTLTQWPHRKPRMTITIGSVAVPCRLGSNPKSRGDRLAEVLALPDRFWAFSILSQTVSAPLPDLRSGSLGCFPGAPGNCIFRTAARTAHPRRVVSRRPKKHPNTTASQKAKNDHHH